MKNTDNQYEYLNFLDDEWDFNHDGDVMSVINGRPVADNIDIGDAHIISRLPDMLRLLRSCVFDCGSPAFFRTQQKIVALLKTFKLFNTDL